MKKSRITYWLQTSNLTDKYKVVKVENTVTYSPGDFLNKSEVQKLIDLGITVKISQEK